MWMAGSKYTGGFYDKQKFPLIPYSKYLEKSSSEMKMPKDLFLKIANLSFIILFIFFLLTSIIYIGAIFKTRKLEVINFFLFNF